MPSQVQAGLWFGDARSSGGEVTGYRSRRTGWLSNPLPMVEHATVTVPTASFGSREGGSLGQPGGGRWVRSGGRRGMREGCRIGEAKNPGPGGGGDVGEEGRAMEVDEAWARARGDDSWAPAWMKWSRQTVRPRSGGGPITIDLVPPMVVSEEAESGRTEQVEWEDEELEVFFTEVRSGGGAQARPGYGRG